MQNNSRNKKNNKNNKNKPYRAQNMYNNKNASSKKIKVANLSVHNLETPAEPETGFISVGVYTALGALPVENAVVTIYIINDEGEEEAIYHLITDENGRVPDIELPVIYNSDDPLESREFYFSTYNMRIQAENYNTFNVQQLRVFPGITTDYNVNLVPVLPGAPNGIKEYNVIIPPSPIDKSNE